MANENAARTFQGLAQLLQGWAAYQAGLAQRDIAGVNARVGRMQARSALARGEMEVGDLRRAARGIIGAQRAGFAGQGIDVESGTALELQADTARLSERDVARLRLAVAMEAWGYRTGASFTTYQGRVAAAEGRAQGIASLLQAGGTFAGMG